MTPATTRLPARIISRVGIWLKTKRSLAVEDDHQEHQADHDNRRCERTPPAPAQRRGNQGEIGEREEPAGRSVGVVHQGTEHDDVGGVEGELKATVGFPLRRDRQQDRGEGDIGHQEIANDGCLLGRRQRIDREIDRSATADSTRRAASMRDATGIATRSGAASPSREPPLSPDGKLCGIPGS